MTPARPAIAPFVAAVWFSAAMSCSATTEALDGLPCGDDGGCVAGYLCDSASHTCISAQSYVPCSSCLGSCFDDTCYEDITTGSSCSSSGLILPCTNGTQDCALSCRTCTGEGTWSSCGGDPCAACPSTDCITMYVDEDGDGFGSTAGTLLGCNLQAGYVANADDCNDQNAHCQDDCTDGDSDTFCLGVDCHDGNGTCTSDCASCDVQESITVTASSTVDVGSNVSLSIQLSGTALDESSNISCVTTPLPLFGPIQFTGQPSLATYPLIGTSTEYRTVAQAPFNGAGCSAQGDFLTLQNGTIPEVKANGTIDATGGSEVKLSFVASGTAGANRVHVASCCGVDCALNLIDPAIQATNCTSSVVLLGHDSCAALSFRINSFKTNGNPADVDVGVDDLLVTAVPTLASIQSEGAGAYSTSLRALGAGTLDITCTWSTGVTSVQDSVSITVQ